MYHQYQVVGEFKDIKSYVESCNNTELVAEIDDYVNAYYGGDYMIILIRPLKLAMTD